MVEFMQSVFFDKNIKSAFDADGMVIVPLLDAAEIAGLIALYESSSENISDRKFHSTMFIDDAGYRKKTDAAIRAVILPKIAGLLRGYRLLFANFIVKEPSSDTKVGIHQDWNFTLPEYTSVNIWIPLVDIDVQTGLFHALKGSHHSFRNIRYTPYPDNAYAGIDKFIFQNSTGFKVKAGEAVIYHGALVHFSDANLSAHRRLALGNVLIPENAPCVHYYKRYPDKKILELYETDESFYNRFNFFEEPKGVRKISEIEDYIELPSEKDLMSARIKI